MKLRASRNDDWQRRDSRITGDLHPRRPPNAYVDRSRPAVDVSFVGDGFGVARTSEVEDIGAVERGGREHETTEARSKTENKNLGRNMGLFS
jgi:hypothetical protein